MRRVGLLVVAIAVMATACGGGTSGHGSSAWIGSPSGLVSSESGVYSFGLDGTVKRGGDAQPAVLPRRGAADPSGRRVAIWKQGGSQPLILHSKAGATRIIATDVATEPAWRPDGGALAFGQLVGHVVRLRVAEAAHSFRVRQLRIALCPGGVPAWSPDGRFLALTSPSDQRHCERGSELLVVDVDGASIAGRQAVSNPTPGLPQWSSDGSYASEGAAIGTPGIALVSRSRRFGVSRVIDDCSQVSWSPRGARFAAACGGQLALIDARTGKRVDLAPSVLVVGPGIIWSHDGARLAATTAGGFLLATTGGRTARVRVTGAWTGQVVGFSPGDRAKVEVSTAPPAD